MKSKLKFSLTFQETRKTRVVWTAIHKTSFIVCKCQYLF